MTNPTVSASYVKHQREHGLHPAEPRVLLQEPSLSREIEELTRGIHARVFEAR